MFQVYAFDPYAPDEETKSASVGEEEERQMESRYDYDSFPDFTNSNKGGGKEKGKEAGGVKDSSYIGLYEDGVDEETRPMAVVAPTIDSYGTPSEEDFYATPKDYK